MERLNVYNIVDMYDSMNNPTMIHIGNNREFFILRKNESQKKSNYDRLLFFCEILSGNPPIKNFINRGLPLRGPYKYDPNHQFFVRRYNKVIDYIFEIKETCNAETK